MTVQSQDEFGELLELDDRTLGALVRATWMNGQYVKFKRMLLKYHNSIHRIQVTALTRDEQMELLHALEREIHRDERAARSQTVQSESDDDHPTGLHVQSEDVIEQNPTGGNDVTHEQTVEFVETTKGSMQGLSANDMSLTNYDATPDVDLGNFLSRPTRILTGTWNLTDSAGSWISLNPWYSFFNDARIKNKVNNFSWIRCNLHVKFIVTSSPFYYGAMLASYHPLLDVNTDTVATTSTLSQFVPRSQRPHVWIYPQENKAGTLVLPFFYHKNWLDIKSATDLQNMGEINMDIISILRSANGASGVGVTVQAFAWATDVELCGPTVGLAVQSQDEYGQGPISKPASALSYAAGKLKDVPIIGKFATATQIGADAVGKVANLFGFTNVEVISDTQPFRPSPFPQLSSSEVGFPGEKLSLDPKNELSVDPSVLGLPQTDELAIDHLVQKESFLTSTTWSTSDAVDSQLFASAISPWMFRQDATAYARTIQLPPVAWIANLFANWRGDVIFRFKFVVSKYHKGRVKISFDPSGQGSNNLIQVTETSNAIYTRIVDVSEEDSVEMRIPYKQAIAWLRTDTSFSNDVWFRRGADSGANFIYDSSKHNGMLTVRVMNTLTAPVASSTIDLLISVRGAENLEFANPTHIGEFSPFNVQSQDEYEDEGRMTTIGAGSSPFSELYLTNYGECIKSLRQLLRRSSLNEVWAEPNDSSSAYYIIQHDFTRFPVPYGFDPSGLWSANKVTTTGTAPFNFTWSTPLNWVMPAFVAARGSTMWTFNPSVNSSVPWMTHVRVVRRPNVDVSACTRTFSTLATKGTTSVNANYFRNQYLSGQAGQALTHQLTQAGLTVTFPHYSRYKFNSTSPAKINAPSGVDGSQSQTSRLEVYLSPAYGTDAHPVLIEKYVSIGADFSLHWFLNVPTTYFYISTITPV